MASPTSQFENFWKANWELPLADDRAEPRAARVVSVLGEWGQTFSCRSCHEDGRAAQKLQEENTYRRTCGPLGALDIQPGGLSRGSGMDLGFQ